MTGPGAELEGFHPAVREWFEGRFPQGPSLPQEHGWPAIADRRDTLIAAPTGSGKTLAAFLVCIDRFYQDALRAQGRRGEAGLPLFGAEVLGPDPAEDEAASRPGIEVVYVSPLKALAADIQHNLQEPLEEIAELARRRGYPVPELRIALRSGDTPASARAAMLKHPPQILVTTPESLYLLLTAERSRGVLGDVRTVIIDEIHAVARDKRGSHLALSLERLEELCVRRPVRIGLSATQRPIETLARLLVGAGEARSRSDGGPRCEVVDVGHRRALDLAIELPAQDLEAVASGQQMGEILDGIAAHVENHQTTLVFVNTRRMAERLAHELAERLGDDAVAAHHGSLSKDRRHRVEARLRAGELRALVATASLELGIDVGPVELVCQMGSPRALSTFLQRVGRSGHSRGGTPKGRIYPTTRDELVECVALLRGVRAGRLDAIEPPKAPLDILAQQIVASCAAEDWREDDLYALIGRAAPFSELGRAEFDGIVEMLSEGIQTGRGRRGAYLHRDRVGGILRARRGARLAALTSGGAIPDVADYRVLAAPDDSLVGSVSEDFAVESMQGDVFLLGSTSWRVLRVESGLMRVADAGGAPPTIPFWQGEAPARSAELSDEVSKLRADVRDRVEAGGREDARQWLSAEAEVTDVVAEQVVAYLATSLTALGSLPTSDELVFERFFDEAGGMQLVVHAPLGGRINRALCLALRKKFCRSFNFELQAAANDDALVLSLGPHHSFPLDSVPRFLNSSQVTETLSQAALASPMFTARWRWNLNRSLAVLRFKGGRRNPPPIQRMESDDLMAAVFPNQAACQENVTFPIEIPEHPLVAQTMHDCLTEGMDVVGLEALVRGFESGEVRTRFVDSSEPSPLAHEILNGRPFTFLDDAPLEERRTRAVALRRGLPVEARELAALDPEAIARVRAEELPQPRGAEELHDHLLGFVLCPGQGDLQRDFEALAAAGRAAEALIEGRRLWCATERRRAAEVIHPEAIFEPRRPLPASLSAEPEPERQTVMREMIRGHLDRAGPATVESLAEPLALAGSDVELALADLEAEGFALRGEFEGSASGSTQFCARRLLARIHRYTRDRLRGEIEPVSAATFIRFLLRWQHVAPGSRCAGRGGVAQVVEQLQGFELAAGAWEEQVLARRIEGYQPGWLDAACLSGEVGWGRLSPGSGPGSEASEKPGEPGAEASEVRLKAVPSRATPLAFVLREDLPWLLPAHRGDAMPAEPTVGAAAEVLAALRQGGALFHSELVSKLSRLPVEVEEGLWALVARGWVSADGFQAVRSLLGARERWARTRARQRARRGLRRGLREGPEGGAEGRWSLFPRSAPVEDPDRLAEAVAEQLLARWGVVFRDLMARENLAVPWRDVVWALRRLEARGLARGGRFVGGFSGEQFALPGAVEALRAVRRKAPEGERVQVAAADPLNLVGILTPGSRVPSSRGQAIVYRDGVPVAPGTETSPETGAAAQP
ncbi:MAG: DEAD/DEAH box helicase [Myxococcota bacterium]|jgi:ATP-dependent helicase Lhr and Lhr-like helicase|nr:DEAD/DEAH box helicase [Myxococcota bacterium]